MFNQSKQFFEQFNNIFAENSPCRAEAIAYYPHSTAFTNFIKKRINYIIESMGYIAMNEYYRIDAIGYTERRELLKEECGLSPQLWDLEIAVEHENSSQKWLDEVVKLAHIYCPLRVVIGYVPAKQRADGDAARLGYASQALQLLKCQDSLAHGTFMVILGNSNVKKKEEDFFNYKAYVLDAKTLSFKSIEMP